MNEPRQLGGTELKRLHRQWKRRSQQQNHRLALLLDNVVGPFNVGSIARSAAAMGVDDIFLVAETPDLQSAKVQKTALGTDRYLHSSRHETTENAIATARRDGYTVIALELADTAIPLPELNLARDICLVLGHEDRGLSKNSLASCDMVSFIPQLGKVGSLNVASAAAIACFEARRQHWKISQVSQ